eukprot:1175730-Prorocentrum_minimum.AAC.4
MKRKKKTCNHPRTPPYLIYIVLGALIPRRSGATSDDTHRGRDPSRNSMCNGTYAMETFDINRKGARGLYLGGTNTSVNLEQQLRTTLKLLNDV